MNAHRFEWGLASWYAGGDASGYAPPRTLLTSHYAVPSCALRMVARTLT